MPFDVWLCLALAVLVALGTGKLAEVVAQNAYQKELETHQPVAGEIGGPAGEEVFRANSVDDLLTHDTFTVVSPGIQYRNEGGGYYGGRYFHSLLLPSGERVAAWVNGDGIQEVGGSDYFSSDKILPLGRVVYEDLASSPTFLDQIEYRDKLSRRDFYIDMVGETAVLAEEQAVGGPKMVVQILTVVVLFPVFHMIGSKLGLFPSYFARKKKPAEWE